MRMYDRLSYFVVLTTVAAIFAGSDARAADDFSDLTQLGGGKFSYGELVVEAELTADDVAAGNEATLSVRVLLPLDSYIYSQNPSFGAATKITVSESSGLEAIDEKFFPDREPKRLLDPLLKQNVEKFYDEVVWTRKYRISPDAELGKITLSGKLEGQYCSSGPLGQCVLIRPPREFHVSLNGQKVVVRKPERKAKSPDAEAKNYLVQEIRPRRKPDRPEEPISFRFELSPKDAKPGDEVTLSVTAKPDDKWHIFALSQDPDMAGLPTEIKIESVFGLKSIDEEFKPSKKYEIKKPLPDIVQRVHHGEIVWSRQYRVTESAETKGFGVVGSVTFQICNDATCRLQPPLRFELTTSRVPEAKLAVAAVVEKDDVRKKGLIPFLIVAALAGFAALLTPCVFPMVPITVSFFLKQSEKEHHKPIRMASVYCLGIVFTFTVLGVLMAAVYGGTSLGKVANNPWMNLAIAGVLVFFGMNLLGMFEIRLPSWLLTWSSGKENQHSLIGVVFMAVTFTLVSFTCTFAFVGSALVWASKGDYYWPVLGMLAFSAAFAMPFFFLALFPSFLQKLPKSGGWMNRVKVTIGMLEIGAALKFFSVADLRWNPTPMIFDYSLVMSVWMVLCICTGVYLLGMFRLPNDTPTESISAPQLAFAMTFLGFAAYLAAGLYAPERPTGKVWEQIAAFAPPSFEGGTNDLGPFLIHDGLKYALDFDQAKKFAVSNKQLLFLDFTGVNCVNCRLMEDRMKLPHNRLRLEKFTRVQLYMDNVPTIRSKEQASIILDRNEELQIGWFGDVTMPAYAVVTPDGKTILATLIGMESRDGEFAEFLDKGLEKWQTAQGKTGEPRVAGR